MSAGTLFLGAAGTGLGVSRSLPHLLRMRRVNHARGVSVASLGAGFVSGTAWAAYGVLADLPAVAIASAAIAIIYALSTGLATFYGGDRDVAVPLLWGATLAAVYAALGTTALGLVLAVTALVNGLPQLWRLRRQEDRSGVSRLGWVVYFVEGALWLSVGLLSGDPAVILGSAAQVGVSSWIVVALTVFRRSPAEPTEAVSASSSSLGMAGAKA